MMNQITGSEQLEKLFSYAGWTAEQKRVDPSPVSTNLPSAKKQEQQGEAATPHAPLSQAQAAKIAHVGGRTSSLIRLRRYP
ncbi:hypothetical protein JIR001_10040 [Polycladomyces abyssicola]|uniref:Uncharacterized protein n=1 Tax=Polycladomyces abyssicola TaxID=1125966 RepID=A0A8D5UD65_9BACL|nr:hypothetical protein JIR001_10040 [Polycladomyces abyssicola]